MKYINNTKTMLYKSKLRGSFGRIYPISLVTVYILCALEAFIRWQFIDHGADIKMIPAVSIILMGLFFMVAGFIQVLKYKIWIYLLLGFFMGVGCFISIFLFSSEDDLLRVIYVVNLLVIILIIIVFWPVLSSQERFEANARRLFKLASELIEDVADGFTERPFSAGKIRIEKDELNGFSRFVNGKFIARTFHLDDGIYYSFSMNESVLHIQDPRKVSYVTISSSGEVKVQISEADYRQYRHRINFDKLCESMAGVFTRFMDYYKEGKEQRIITELKTAR